MKVQAATMSVAWIASFVLSGVVAAQDPTPDSNLKRIEQLEERIKGMQRQTVSKQQLTEAMEGAATREDLLELVELVKENSSRLDDMSTLVADVNVRHGQLRTEYEQTKGLAGEMSSQFYQIVKSDTRERPVLDLRAMMNGSQEFQNEFSNAIHGSMRERGKLRIENNTSVDQSVLVNGRQYYVVPANSTRDIDVPVGTNSTELVGYERAKNWTVGPPNYVQPIVISRNSPTVQVVRRPATTERVFYADPPTYIGSPTYVETPLYVGPSIWW